jgi:hypothetical protein
MRRRHDGSRTESSSLFHRSERQQGDIPRLLNRIAQPTLMRGANACQTPWNDLAALGHELPEQAHVLIVDRIDLLDAELANLLAAEELPSAITP